MAQYCSARTKGTNHCVFPRVWARTLCSTVLLAAALALYGCVGAAVGAVGVGGYYGFKALKNDDRPPPPGNGSAAKPVAPRQAAVPGTTAGPGESIRSRQAVSAPAAPPGARALFNAGESAPPGRIVAAGSMPASQPSGFAVIEWRTGREIQLLGYNVYRAPSIDGPWTQANPKPIPGTGDSAGPHYYKFIDSGLESGSAYYYYLEEALESGEHNRISEVFARTARNQE